MAGSAHKPASFRPRTTAQLREDAQSGLQKQIATTSSSKLLCRTAGQLLTSGEENFLAEDHETAYINLMRGITLVLETIPARKDGKEVVKEEAYSKLRKRAEPLMGKLEELSKIIKERCDEWDRNSNLSPPTPGSTSPKPVPVAAARRPSTNSSTNGSGTAVSKSGQGLATPPRRSSSASASASITRAAVSGNVSSLLPPPGPPRGAQPHSPFPANAPASTSSAASVVRASSPSSFLHSTSDSHAERGYTPPAVFRPSSNPPPLSASTNSLSAAELFDILLRSEASVLVLDVRPMEDFLGGHMKWRRKRRIGGEFGGGVVQLEPEWFGQESMKSLSSADIENYISNFSSSSNLPQHLFATRHTFDLVVYADSSSSTLSASQSLRPLVQAIYGMEVHRPLRRAPVLLEGGFEAWERLLNDRQEPPAAWIEIGEGCGGEDEDPGAWVGPIPPRQGAGGQTGGGGGGRVPDGGPTAYGGGALESPGYMRSSHDYILRAHQQFPVVPAFLPASLPTPSQPPVVLSTASSGPNPFTAGPASSYSTAPISSYTNASTTFASASQTLSVPAPIVTPTPYSATRYTHLASPFDNPFYNFHTAQNSSAQQQQQQQPIYPNAVTPDAPSHPSSGVQQSQYRAGMT
ncbi:hypothetical protein BDK51DRAFT_27904, partial [Blyttiomyces helicus]